MNINMLTPEQQKLFERYRVMYRDTQPARAVLTDIISELTDRLADSDAAIRDLSLRAIRWEMAACSAYHWNFRPVRQCIVEYQGVKFL